MEEHFYLKVQILLPTAYSIIYNKYIVNLEGADDEIKFFHENGYLKPKLNFKTEVNQLMETLDENRTIRNNPQLNFY